MIYCLHQSLLPGKYLWDDRFAAYACMHRRILLPITRLSHQELSRVKIHSICRIDDELESYFLVKNCISVDPSVAPHSKLCTNALAYYC